MTAAHDHRVGALVAPRAEAFGRRAPRTARIASCRGLAFATAVRMIDRIHRHAAHRRADAAPAHASGLADRLERMLFVADLADGRATVDVHFANLTRAQPQLRVAAFAREQLRGRAGGARELRAL